MTADTREELAGLLRERVVIEARAASRDEQGAEAGPWQRLATVSAALLPDGGGAFEGEAARSRRRWLVTVRAGLRIDLSMRLGWRGRWLAILAIREDPARPDRLVLRAEERP